MNEELTAAEHKKRIDNVLDYILGNHREEISLKTLADIAHYSPFYLQKIFKQYVGESPKQYVMRLRLETALHYLIIDPEKPVLEVALDGGFSSPAVFSRAVRNFYGISPEQFRQLPMQERSKYIRARELKKDLMYETAEHVVQDERQLEISIVRLEPKRGIYILTQFDDKDKIRQAFRDLLNQAESYDLEPEPGEMYGIVSPHQNMYKAFVVLKPDQQVPQRIKTMEVDGGKFASFNLKGDRTEILRSAHVFFKDWLPESAYKVGDIVGLEKFLGNPATTDYDTLERKAFIRLEPK
ncbi:MAG: helix-turn-helix protein [Crocinitomicaceae bacterium]|jgi:AraC family transcriptional regulator|nr:helix-turn-helix protein [Crocinitomicaceae bacterium]